MIALERVNGLIFLGGPSSCLQAINMVILRMRRISLCHSTASMHGKRMHVCISFFIHRLL